MPKERNRCPYCGRWFVVANMTEYHVDNNQCGWMPPQDTVDTGP